MSSASAQDYISEERIYYRDGEFDSSHLTAYERNDNEIISTRYDKNELNDDYSLSSRYVDRENNDNRYRYQLLEFWDHEQDKWISRFSREMIFDENKCEHKYIVDGYMAFIELDGPVELTISYEDNCTEPWIVNLLPSVYDVDRVESWTRKKTVSGSVTTYTDNISNVYSPTYTWHTYRERLYIDGKLRKYTTTHTDWGYLEKTDYMYDDKGDISKVVRSNLSAPNGEWFRQDTFYYKYRYFEDRLYERNSYGDENFSTKIETIKYYYDCSNRLIERENYYKGELEYETFYNFEDEPKCPEKESFFISLLNNPIGNQLTFITDTDLEDAQIHIFNVSGQLSIPTINSVNPYTYTIDMDNYPPGMYILHVECKGLVSTLKFLRV